MSKHWHPEGSRRWISPAAYQALSPAAKRALWREREAARAQRALHAFHRVPDARSHRPRTDFTTVIFRLVLLVAAAAFATWHFYVPTGFMRPPALSATGKAEVRASFASCKWGGGYNCVVDGDTLYLEGQKIRIAGIDAPETHDYGCESELALGEQSAARLQALVGSGAVSLTRIDRDSDVYGRRLRNVAVDGRDVGDVLVSEGLARPYGGGRRSWCG